MGRNSSWRRLSNIFSFSKEGKRERGREKESFERAKLKLIFRIVRDVEEGTIISRYDKSIVSVKMHFDEEIEIYIDGK